MRHPPPVKRPYRVPTRSGWPFKTIILSTALARKIQKQTCQEPKEASFCTLAPRNRFLTRLSATKPITSHEAFWPCQGQPCSVPGSYWLVILDIGIEIAKTLDRSDHDRDLVAQLRATAGGNCQLLPMSLRLATICTGSALDAVGHSARTDRSLEARGMPWIREQTSMDFSWLWLCAGLAGLFVLTGSASGDELRQF